MDPVKAFKKSNDVTRIQSTLFEIVVRDAATNPILYSETEIMEDMVALNHFISRINQIDYESIGRVETEP
jgi:hypothetical protein